MTSISIFSWFHNPNVITKNFLELLEILINIITKCLVQFDDISFRNIVEDVKIMQMTVILKWLKQTWFRCYRIDSI